MTKIDLIENTNNIIMTEKGNYINTLEEKAVINNDVPYGTIIADIYCIVVSAVSTFLSGNNLKYHYSFNDDDYTMCNSIGAYLKIELMPYGIYLSKKIIDDINTIYKNYENQF